MTVMHALHPRSASRSWCGSPEERSCRSLHAVTCEECRRLWLDAARDLAEVLTSAGWGADVEHEHGTVLIGATGSGAEAPARVWMQRGGWSAFVYSDPARMVFDVLPSEPSMDPWDVDHYLGEHYDDASGWVTTDTPGGGQ